MPSWKHLQCGASILLPEPPDHSPHNAVVTSRKAHNQSPSGAFVASDAIHESFGIDFESTLNGRDIWGNMWNWGKSTLSLCGYLSLVQRCAMIEVFLHEPLGRCVVNHRGESLAAAAGMETRLHMKRVSDQTIAMPPFHFNDMPRHPATKSHYLCRHLPDRGITAH